MGFQSCDWQQLREAFAADQWRIRNDDPCPAAQQMQRDLEASEQGRLQLRLFRWDPVALSTGLKQQLPDWWTPEAWHSKGIEVVERPTGGGVAFHGSDLSWSVVIPRSLKAPLDVWMRLVCHSAAELCRAVGAPAQSLLDAGNAERIIYCLTQDSPYAIMIQGRKVAGYAIRRMPNSWLIQASMLVSPLRSGLAEILPAAVLHDLHMRAIPLSEAATEPVTPESVARLAAERWVEWWNTGIEQISNS